MKLRLIYPRWPKLTRQTEFTLPPHGPVVFAASVPPDVEVEFTDEIIEEIDYDESVDLVGMSVMLTCQIKRAFEIADEFRRRGTKVIFGGIATMLHSDEVLEHADSVFLGEVEGRFHKVIEDLREGRLQKVYDFMSEPPCIDIVPTARRDILERDRYDYEKFKMVDLVHASRGCRFNCKACCVGFLGGKVFRPRPYDAVVKELGAIENDRIFFVDNSMAQDTKWELGLFEAIKPLGLHWICHPLEKKEQVVKAAAEAGCWYVYQAVIDDSDRMRSYIEMLHDHGIGVEATVLLGMEDHTEDSIKRLVDFLLEMELDMAEFTVLTPFPRTEIYEKLHSEGRILSYDWNDYTADKVVYQPKHMTPERLQELYYYAWDTFYEGEPQRFKMYKLLKRVM